jgi:hypothetical protein
MNEGLDNTQASPVHHDFMDEDPPFVPTSPFPHDPMNEGLGNARSSSPYRMNFEDYAPNSPPFHEHMDHSPPRARNDRDNDISHAGSDHESHTGNDREDMASGANSNRSHTRSARVTRAYHTMINGMCPLLFVLFRNDIDSFMHRKTL